MKIMKSFCVCFRGISERIIARGSQGARLMVRSVLDAKIAAAGCLVRRGIHFLFFFVRWY